MIGVGLLELVAWALRSTGAQMPYFINPEVDFQTAVAALILLVSVGVPVPATPPPDPASKGLTLAQGSRCGWKSERCQPPWWKFHATLDRQRHLEGEACERHLWILYDRVVTRLRAHAMKPKTPRGRPKRVYRTGPGRPKKHG